MKWLRALKAHWWDADRGSMLVLVILTGVALGGAGSVYLAYDRAFIGSVLPKVSESPTPVNATVAAPQQLRIKKTEGKELVIELPSAPSAPPTLDDQYSEKRAEFGQVGDFFGGVLNPIFAFLSFMGVVATLSYQRRELKASQEELRLSRAVQAQSVKAIESQRFEQTFFAWLNTYRELLSSVEWQVKVETGSAAFSEVGGVMSGRKALQNRWNWRLSAHGIQDEVIRLLEHDEWDAEHWSATDGEYGGWDYYEEDGGGSWSPSKLDQSDFNKVILSLLRQERQDVLIQAALKAWDRVYREEEFQLDSLFRSLYRLILWVDTQPHLTIEDKWLYVSIVRSQLSSVEMGYLFYNGLTLRGANFKKLVNRYALFDNLSVESDFIFRVFREFPLDEQSYAPTAYSSDLARVALGLSSTGASEPSSGNT